jgi:ankyrin repeat protein
MNDYTALQVAVIERRSEIVSILLAHGADPLLRTRIDDFESAVDLALQSGDRHIIELVQGS